ncbi:hypothetical protein C7974DRAFT_440438 [Boeremia exigua]|uniref:uncharacterized protein n=1 Tax=Boeremia exigua TaxID=749465 RepID=UPI001E8ECF4C|nr:uncharacterized protein C7974DRAFT_440438 [Boeremia exigua]KAH6644846.1 hypothetical protein C7974DRAFT_440438 [Boeremia exigua]
MPRGSISQVLKIATLPPGVTMTITDVRFTIPEGKNSWWPTFAGITKNTPLTTQSDGKRPFEVSPTINDGRVGEVGLTSLSVFDSGPGPSVCIDFTLSGPFFANATTKEHKGTINVSTSEWGGWMSCWGNASEIVVVYNFLNSPAVTQIVKIPTSGHTLELMMELGLDETKTKLAMKWATETSLAFSAANMLLGGVYVVHAKTYQWAFSAIGGWPAVLGAAAKAF